MKRFNRFKVALITGVLSLAMVLSGCGSSGTKDQAATDSNQVSNEKQVHVAMVLKTLSSQYWKLVAAGAQDAAKKYNVKLTLLGPNAESEVVQQVNMMEDALTQNPDVLAVAPSQPPTAIPVFEKAKQKNIPVILVDTDAPWDDKATYIGTANKDAGRQGGEYLASLLKKGDKVALLEGARGNTAMDDRIKGAEEALAAAGIQVVAKQPANSDRALGMNVMQNILQSHPDIKGVYSANDEMALGAIRALQQNKKNIPVVGTDAIPDAVKAIIDGSMTASVAQKPYDMGYLAIEAAVKLVKGETLPKYINSGTELITKENAQAKLDWLNKTLSR